MINTEHQCSRDGIGGPCLPPLYASSGPGRFGTPLGPQQAERKAWRASSVGVWAGGPQGRGGPSLRVAQGLGLTRFLSSTRPHQMLDGPLVGNITPARDSCSPALGPLCPMAWPRTSASGLGSRSGSGRRSAPATRLTLPPLPAFPPCPRLAAFPCLCPPAQDEDITDQGPHLPPWRRKRRPRARLWGPQVG